MDALVTGLRAIHDTLRERLELAATSQSAGRADRPRDEYPAIDTFLASASRHNAAMLAVIAPAARGHLDDGHDRVRAYVAQSRRLEVALNQVKAKLYGSTYAIRRPWPSIWDDVRREFAATRRLELRLCTDLAEVRRGDDPDWAQKLYRAEITAPTRPHPHIPHQGTPGRVARSVARHVDEFWDAAEGRMIPEPLHHHDREHDGLLTQYLLADPHLPEDDEEQA